MHSAWRCIRAARARFFVNLFQIDCGLFVPVGKARTFRRARCAFAPDVSVQSGTVRTPFKRIIRGNCPTVISRFVVITPQRARGKRCLKAAIGTFDSVFHKIIVLYILLFKGVQPLIADYSCAASVRAARAVLPTP